MTYNKTKLNLYERLPEIYRIKDSEQQPPYQLKNYLSIIEEIFLNIKNNIDCLYQDHFIELCSDWVIPYIGDLLGTSNLSGDPWTLRADIADTIALKRRKGTIGAIERLTYDLTEWGVHCVELRENLLWIEHLNHQRPDVGGNPPYGLGSIANIYTPIRGGVVTLRKPGIVSLLDTPFDPFAHIIDLKPVGFNSIRYNIFNLAVFLWLLRPYQIQFSKPTVLDTDIIETGAQNVDNAKYIVHIFIHPLRDLVKLYNTSKFNFGFSTLKQINPISKVDEEPIQIFRSFLNKYPPPSASPPSSMIINGQPTMRDVESNYLSIGNPDAYVSISTFDDIPTRSVKPTLDSKGRSIQIYFPSSIFPNWINSNSDITIKDENLLNWEKCLNYKLKNKEIVIDPLLGRIMIGVGTSHEAMAIQNKTFSFFYICNKW